MIYAIIAVIFSAFIIWISVLGEKKPDQNKLFIRLNALLAILGALTFTSVFFIVKHLIFSIKDDQEFVEWAWDMFTLYYSISLPVFLVLILVLLLSVLLSIFQDPKRGSSSPVIRVMAATASSVLMLLIAPCYGFMTDNQIISIYPYILVSGLAEALIFRIVFVLEYFIRSKTNVKNR